MSRQQEIYTKLSAMICDAKDLEQDEISPEMTLPQLNFDSLDYVELMVLAKSEYAVELNAEFFLAHPDITLTALCDYIDSKGPA